MTSWSDLSVRLTRLMLIPVAGYGQGGHHHGQVGLDGVSGVVEDGAGSQVVLAHPERGFDVPQP